MTNENPTFSRFLRFYCILISQGLFIQIFSISNISFDRLSIINSLSHKMLAFGFDLKQKTSFSCDKLETIVQESI